MILATKSNNVVLVGVHILGDTLAAAAAYVNTPAGSVVQLFEVGQEQPRDLGYWKVPDQGFTQGVVNPVIVLTATKKPGT